MSPKVKSKQKISISAVFISKFIMKIFLFCFYKMKLRFTMGAGIFVRFGACPAFIAGAVFKIATKLHQRRTGYSNFGGLAVAAAGGGNPENLIFPYWCPLFENARTFFERKISDIS